MGQNPPTRDGVPGGSTEGKLMCGHSDNWQAGEGTINLYTPDGQGHPETQAHLSVLPRAGLGRRPEHQG